MNESGTKTTYVLQRFYKGELDGCKMEMRTNLYEEQIKECLCKTRRLDHESLEAI